MFLPLKVIRNKNGFTLVELIVVMAVLAIISAIAVPRFLGVQEKAKEDADYSTGAMIAKAAELYEAKTDNVENSITADVLVTAGYINGIEFKSDTFLDCEANELTINYGAGSLTIMAATGETTSLQLYPRPPVTP